MEPKFSRMKRSTTLRLGIAGDFQGLLLYRTLFKFVVFVCFKDLNIK